MGHQRIYLKPDKTIGTVHLKECRCIKNDRRGPGGGVCGCCGNAILDVVERLAQKRLALPVASSPKTQCPDM